MSKHDIPLAIVLERGSAESVTYPPAPETSLDEESLFN